MASSLCQVKIGAGAYAAVAGGINVAPADVITIKLVSAAGVDTGSWSIQCLYTDETKVPATITALLSVNQTTFEATFTVPAGTGQALIFQSQVNNDATTRTTFGLYTLVGSLRCGAVNETYEGSATYGWAAKVNAAIRALAGASYTAPTGTGIPHIVAGVQDAASSLIVNADVHASAAIALSKIVNPTGTGLVKASGGVFAAAAALLVNADVDAAAAVAVSKLAAGTNGHVLTTSAGVPTWAANAAAALPTGCSALAAVQDVAAAGLTSDLALTDNAFITLLRFTDAVAPSVDGIVSGSGAFRIVIIRPSAASVAIVDYTTSVSAAANQFETAVTLAATGAGGIWAYDPTSLRWINLGHQF